jgi:hypothetical protein
MELLDICADAIGATASAMIAAHVAARRWHPIFMICTFPFIRQGRLQTAHVFVPGTKSGRSALGIRSAVPSRVIRASHAALRRHKR